MNMRQLKLALFGFLLFLVGVSSVIFLIVPPGAETELSGTLVAPYAVRNGLAWIATVPESGDTMQAPSVSRLVLYENGAKIGPAHSQHDEVSTLGAGRYSHWDRTIIFSTSDGSDPNANGRRYEWRTPKAILPFWSYWFFLSTGAIGAFGTIVLFGSCRFLTLSFWIALGVFSVIVVEGGSALLLQKSLATADVQRRQLFDRVMARQDKVEASEGSVLNYLPHPYLGFALNPKARYAGMAQYNADFLIRRAEKLRDRRDVSLRILVLGGSTTFGAGISREEDTWVYRLEANLRKRLGADVDVINGGVGGYNIVENTIHYALLLQKLQPDVVMLVTGVNDVHPRLIGDLRPDYSNARKVWDGDGLDGFKADWRFAWSSFYRLMIWQRVLGGQLGHIYVVIQRPYPPVESWRHQLERNGPSEYERHLMTLGLLLRSEGRHVIIVPQPWIARQGHPEDDAFGIGVREHNEVMKKAAMTIGVPFADDADGVEIRKRYLFWDAVHFNEQGSLVMAGLMTNWLCSQIELLEGKSCSAAE